jgi:hypothetical protein
MPPAVPLPEQADHDHPPVRRRRRILGERLPWRTILLESFFIVVAILLALAADGWRERRQEQELARTALARFHGELVANRAEVVAVRPYHDSLLTSMRGALGTAGPIPSIAAAVPGFRGMRPAFLLNTAWETALATGALRHIDYETVHALSVAYAFQDGLRAFNQQMMAAILTPETMSRSDSRPVLVTAAAYFTDVTIMEARLLEQYEQLLPRLARQAGLPDSAAIAAARPGL